MEAVHGGRRAIRDGGGADRDKEDDRFQSTEVLSGVGLQCPDL